MYAHTLRSRNHAERILFQTIDLKNLQLEFDEWRSQTLEDLMVSTSHLDSQQLGFVCHVNVAHKFVALGYGASETSTVRPTVLPKPSTPGGTLPYFPIPTRKRDRKLGAPL